MGIDGGRGFRRLVGLTLAAALLTGCGGKLMDDVDAAGEVAPSATPESVPATAPSASEQDEQATPETLPSPSLKPKPAKKKQIRKPLTRADLTVPKLNLPPVYDGPVLGGDISWPQCPPGMGIPEKRTLGMPMPLPQAKYVVIGLTNGPGFTPNPCLKSQVDWVKQRHLMASAYAVHSFPDSTTLARYGGKGPFDAGTDQGRLQNVGYQQSLYNLGSLRPRGCRARSSGSTSSRCRRSSGAPTRRRTPP